MYKHAAARGRLGECPRKMLRSETGSEAIFRPKLATNLTLMSSISSYYARFGQ